MIGSRRRVRRGFRNDAPMTPRGPRLGPQDDDAWNAPRSPLEHRDQARCVPAPAAHLLHLRIELVDQRGDREMRPVAARFAHADGEILAHPIHREAEIELAGRHGLVAVLHLPGLRRALGDGGDERLDVEPGLLGKVDAFGEALNEARSAIYDLRPATLDDLGLVPAIEALTRRTFGPDMEVNVATAVNVLEAWRLDAPRARMVWVSSSEVYGNAAQLPIVEDAPVQPANPYAVSKLTGDLLAGVYADAHGLDLVRARPFNHAGPGQRPVFIVSSLARQAAEGRLSGAHRIRIATGNPDTRRDFTDVRDVVRGYRLLAERARPGVYNVCSGRSISPADQIRMLAEVVAPLEIEHEVDPARVRAHEVMDLRGSNARIRSAVGWQPEIPFEQTIRDTVQWWVQELEPAADGAARS